MSDSKYSHVLNEIRDFKETLVQSNFSGSNTFGTRKICLRQGEFELMSVNHSARSRGIIGISFRFSLT